MAQAWERIRLTLDLVGEEAAMPRLKEVRHLPEQPFFVVGVELRLPWYKFQSGNAEQQITERVAGALRLPGRCLVLALNRHRATIRRKLKRIPGTELLRR